MSKYNITVVRISKTSNGGYEGEFTLSDTGHLVLRDGVVRQVQATISGAVDSIVYGGAHIAKIRGTQGQRRGHMVPGRIVDTGEEVLVDWQAGHRSAVAAAFASAWSQLAASGVDHIDRPTITARTKAAPVVAAPVPNKELEDLKAAVALLAEQNALLLAKLETAPKGK